MAIGSSFLYIPKKISLIHEGINTDYFGLDPGATLTVPGGAEKRRSGHNLRSPQSGTASGLSQLHASIGNHSEKKQKMSYGHSRW